VFEAAGCSLKAAPPANGDAAGGVMTMRADGRMAAIAPLVEGVSRQCRQATLALLGTYVATADHLEETVADGERLVLVVPLHAEYRDCQAQAFVAPVGDLRDIGSNPTLRSSAKPKYPASALSERVQGQVDLEGVVSRAGCVSEAYVVRSGDRRFEPEALKAVSLFRFSPATSDGVPAPSVVQFQIAFNLKQ
jgi:TonB family protein